MLRLKEQLLPSIGVAIGDVAAEFVDQTTKTSTGTRQFGPSGSFTNIEDPLRTAEAIGAPLVNYFLFNGRSEMLDNVAVASIPLFTKTAINAILSLMGNPIRFNPSTNIPRGQIQVRRPGPNAPSGGPPGVVF